MNTVALSEAKTTTTTEEITTPAEVVSGPSVTDHAYACPLAYSPDGATLYYTDVNYTRTTIYANASPLGAMLDIVVSKVFDIVVSKMFTNEDGNLWVFGTDNITSSSKLYLLDKTDLSVINNGAAILSNVADDTKLTCMYYHARNVYLSEVIVEPPGTQQVSVYRYNTLTSAFTTLHTIDVGDIPADGPSGVATIWLYFDSFCVAPDETIYFCESLAYASATIRKLVLDGTITTIAGVFKDDVYVDGVAGVGRLVNGAGFLFYNVVDGFLYFVDSVAAVRRCTTDGTLSTYIGDNSQATNIDGPLDVARTYYFNALTCSATGIIGWQTTFGGSALFRSCLPGSTEYITITTFQHPWDLMLDQGKNIASYADAQAIAQDVASALMTFLGEVYYDTELGIPYMMSITGQVYSAAFIRDAMETAALTVPGVTSAAATITSFINRKVTGSIVVNGDSGDAITITF